MKKVVHVFTVSMSIVFLEDIYSKLKERGYELIIICSDGEEIRRQVKQSDFKFYPVSINRGINPFKDLIALIKIIFILNKEKPSIVHGHTPKGGFLGMLAAKIANVKNRPFHLHGFKFPGESGFKKKLIKVMEKKTIKLSTVVYSVSKSLSQYAIDKGLTTEHKIRVIHNGSVKGIDIQESQTIIDKGKDYFIKKFNIKKFKCIVGYVGRITEEKGIAEFMFATKRLISRGYDIGIVLCGPNELTTQESIKKFSKFVQLENVQYFNKVNNPLEYMICCDIFVLPTYREGFGLVNIEANSVGVPVITTDIIGCIDSIDNNTGIIVQSRDIESLYRALKRLIKNPSLRKSMGMNGIIRVRELYNREKIWNKLISEYDNMLSRSRIK